MKENQFRFYKVYTSSEKKEVFLIVARDDEELFWVLDQIGSPYEFVIEELDSQKMPPLLFDFTPSPDLKEELFKIPSSRVLNFSDLDKAFERLVVGYN